MRQGIAQNTRSHQQQLSIHLVLELLNIELDARSSVSRVSELPHHKCVCKSTAHSNPYHESSQNPFTQACGCQTLPIARSFLAPILKNVLLLIANALGCSNACATSKA